MPQSFQKVVESILPSEEKLLSRLRSLSGTDRQGLAEYFGIMLPEFDLVVAMPHTEPLAQDLAKLRGLSVLIAEHDEQTRHWSLPPSADKDIQDVVIVTDQLNSGLSELKVAMLAGMRGWRVMTIAAAVERTNAAGRARVELQGITITPAVQIADTPRGLVMERRFPQPSLPV